MSQDKTTTANTATEDTDFLSEIEGTEDTNKGTDDTNKGTENTSKGTEEEGTEEDTTEEEEGKRKRKTPEEVENYRKLCISIGELSGMRLTGEEKVYSLTVLLTEDQYQKVTQQRNGAQTKYGLDSLKTLNPIANNVLTDFLCTDFSEEESVQRYIDLLREDSLLALEYEAIIPRPRGISMLEKAIADMQKMIDLFEENNAQMVLLVESKEIPEIAKGSLRSTIENNNAVLKVKKQELEIAGKKLSDDLADFAKMQAKKNLALEKARKEREKKEGEDKKEDK